MIKFLLDEDLPRSTAKVLRNQGYEVVEVRDTHLKAKPDSDVFKFAQKQDIIILTADMGFSSTHRFPPGTHSGIVVVHFPNEVSNDTINSTLAAALKTVEDSDFTGNLIIIEPGRMRMRRADAPKGTAT
jgi:predicted nuclease of predicted toxin-antitoxin system